MMGFVGLFQFAVKCFDILAWPLLALGYPLCASIQAIETNSNSDTQKLITYWVSFSLILLFECAFEKLLEWLTFWPHIKLMIVGCLVVHHFDGSLYVYKHLVDPCLSMDLRIVVSQFNKLKELLFKKDDFVVEVERYVKENGRDALENLIAFKKKSAKPDVAVKEMKALAAEDLPKCAEPKLSHKESNAVEITEQQEAATTKQVREIEPTTARAVNRAFAPLEIKDTAAAAVTGGDIFEIPPSEKVQKEWTCAICQVTTQSETVLNSHLQGNRHKAACERLKKSAEPDVAAKEMKALAAENLPKCEAPKLPHKESNAVEITEQKEAAMTKEVREIEANIARAVNRAFAPLEIKDTATAEVTGRDIFEIPPSEKVQKEWTCAIRGVKTQSETVLNSHLQGNCHQAACEWLKAKKQMLRSEVSPALVGKIPNIPNATAGIGVKIHTCKDAPKTWTCVVCGVKVGSQIDIDAHLQGRRHKEAVELLKAKNQASTSKIFIPRAGKESNVPKAKKEGEQENLLKSQVVEIINGKWWCTICNISCNWEGDMDSHLGGKKHLAKMRELSNVGDSGHA